MKGWLLAAAIAVIGCGRAEGTPEEPVPPAVAAPAVDVHREIAELDGRTPVPLLPMMAAHQREQMRDHLAVVQEVAGAVARDDLEAAARSAERLGTSDSMTAMCTHMGAGAPGFTERALDMHRRADGIASAARAGDRAATLGALADTLEACTSCHASYRQEIVDPETFRARTGGAAPHHGP